MLTLFSTEMIRIINYLKNIHNQIPMVDNNLYGEQIFRYISLIHKGAIETARVKYISSKRKNEVLKDIQRQIDRMDINKARISLIKLYSIVDGVEIPLFKALLRHFNNYSHLIEFMTSNVSSDELKKTIYEFKGFIDKIYPNIQQVKDLIDSQAKILGELKDNEGTDLEAGIKQIAGIQESINKIYKSLEEESRKTLNPMLSKLVPKKSAGERIKTALRLPSKKQLAEAYTTYDEQIKYNTALAISELGAIIGGISGAGIAYYLTKSRYIGGAVGSVLGDYIFGVSTFLPPWYIFNMKKLWAKDSSIAKKHLEFFKYTAEILAKNIPPAALSYGLGAGSTLALTAVVHPSVAAGITGIAVTPVFQSMSTWINKVTFKKMKASKIKIEKEIDSCIDQLSGNSLSVPNNWWWYKKEQMYKLYSGRIKDMTRTVTIIEIRLKKDLSDVPKGSSLADHLNQMLNIVGAIETSLGQLNNETKRLVSNEFLPLVWQKAVADAINRKRNEIKSQLQAMKEKIMINAP